MIELKNVTKTYPNGTRALTGLDLTIETGEFVFIVGESGSGKSTLLKLLLRDEEVTSGSITVDGCDLASLKKREIPYYRRKLGVVFQDFRLFPDKTVYENVAFALRVIGERTATVKIKVNAALKIVDLADKAKCYPNELSGGEQQRVAFARALANGAGIIIADEPTGNIDPRRSHEIMEMLVSIQRRYQKTVIVVTHERALAELFLQRIVTIHGGKVVEDKPGMVITDLLNFEETEPNEEVGMIEEIDQPDLIERIEETETVEEIEKTEETETTEEIEENPEIAAPIDTEEAAESSDGTSLDAFSLDDLFDELSPEEPSSDETVTDEPVSEDASSEEPSPEPQEQSVPDEDQLAQTAEQAYQQELNL